MKNMTFLIVLVIILHGCTPSKFEVRQREFAPVESFLTELNQKVIGYFYAGGVPDGFNESQYKAIVEKVCYPFPVCKKEADALFHDYDVKARKVDDIFTVMLCGKESHNKIMEDFSCNNMLVEVRTWEKEETEHCDYEPHWIDIMDQYCRH